MTGDMPEKEGMPREGTLRGRCEARNLGDKKWGCVVKSVFFLRLQDLCLLLSSLWPRNVPAERPLSHLLADLFIFDKALTSLS